MRRLPDDITLKKDFGFVLDEVVCELTKISGEHVSVILNMVAAHYNIATENVIECLNLVGSDFTLNKNRSIIYHDGTRFVRRTTYIMRIKKIFMNLASKLTGIFEDDTIDYDLLVNTLEDYYAK